MDEKRLIYADSLITGLNRVLIMGRNAGKTMAIAEHIVKTVIANATAVDAAEVVRCRDCDFCNYNSSNNTYKCRSMNGMYRTVGPDEFCSYGERRDDGKG